MTVMMLLQLLMRLMALLSMPVLLQWHSKCDTAVSAIGVAAVVSIKMSAGIDIARQHILHGGSLTQRRRCREGFRR
jgi:hypothetical protein